MKVVTEEDFKSHTGFELTNYEKAPSFTLYNCDTIEVLHSNKSFALGDLTD